MATSTPGNQWGFLPNRRVSDSVIEMFDSGKFSDLTIKSTIDEQTFQVHKVIVCPQSMYFMAACSSNFKVRREKLFSVVVGIERALH